MAAAQWCEDERLLSSLYRFRHRAWGEQQGEGDIAGYRALLERFLKRLAQEGQQLWPGLAKGDLASMQGAAALLASRALWFGENGAALLALPAGEPDIQPQPGDLALLAVGLDDWRFAVHSTDNGGIHHAAECPGSTAVHCGQVHASQLADFKAELASVLAKIKSRKGDQRSAHDSELGSRQGHQKTPALIRAAALQALTALAAKAAGKGGGDDVPEEVPQGGTTDVGMHTGGRPRDTAWPLVREAFKAALAHAPSCRSPNADLPQLAEAHLHLWLLQRQVALVTADTATATALSAAMLMLEAVAGRVAQLAERGHSVDHFEAACSSARRKLEEARAARAEAVAAAAQLPPLDAAGFGPASYRLPRGVLPPLPQPAAEGGGLEAAKGREHRNLGSLPLPADPRPSFAGLLSVLRSAELAQQGDVAAQHALCMVERELFGRAARGFGQEAGLGEEEVDALVDVVEAYRSALHKFLATPAASARMQADLRSRGVLVCWAALCMVHAATARQHPLLLEYGVGVDWRQLRHLVLSDKAAADDALRAVAAYLRRHTRPSRAVFTLADGGQATFELARRFAQQDSRLLQLWSEEQAAAAQRRAAHWAAVQAKQHEVARLRVRLVAKKAAEDAAYKEYTEASSRWYELQYTDRREEARRSSQSATDRYDKAQSARVQTEAAIKSALVPPHPVIQPLPANHSVAAVWLFFAHMPPLFRQLARVSFAAQQALLPPTSAVLDIARVNVPKTWLIDHYNNQQNASDYDWLSGATTGRSGSNGNPALLYFASDSELPRLDQVKKSTVDHYHTSGDGVWHPDGLSQRLAWRGTGASADGALGGAWHNPWAAVPPRQLTDAFTEQLPKGCEALQWALPLYDEVAAERGNLAIARQDQRPQGWLSKPGFLAFGALRAYPLTQFRQLCEALRKGELPWDQPAVQALARQAAYHVGQLTDAERPAPQWRTEWDVPTGVLATLHAELARLAAELEHAPRQHGAVALLGELAAYFSCWHEPLREVARRFAAAAARWADELEAEAAAAPPEAARPLRAKQCLLRMTALLCHAAGPLSDADVEGMLGLAVQAHHGAIYGHGTELQGRLAELQVRCHWALARRIDAILAAANRRPSILTSALRRVLHRAPPDLDWGQLHFVSGPHTASFQAEGSDGHLYSINCLDGTVLEDGAPPGRLPREILSHRLYKRSFGDWGFEVTLTSGGVRRTIAPVAGRFYEFWLAGEGEGAELAVIEVEMEGQRGAAATQEKRRMQLLDPGSELAGGAWGADLPPRLRELHSHWLDRDGGVMVLRPLHFRKHMAAFLLRCAPAASGSGTGGQAVDYVCRRVPNSRHLSHRDDWARLLALHGGQLTDQLVLHSSRVTGVLSKFERHDFVHCYVPYAPAASGGSSAGDASSGSTGGGGSSSASSASASGEPVAAASQQWQMLFELPRFGLEFELAGGLLRSRDHAGYCLAPCQQLWAPAEPANSGAGPSFTLPDFAQYLILQPAAPQGAGGSGGSSSSGAGPPQRTKVLVPVGRVQRQAARVAVAHSSSSGHRIEAHTFELHPRFGHLTASSVHSRLQLAALYAATSSLLPEPLSRQTGAQMAMQLLRQCWGVRPLGDDEVQQALDAVRLGGHLAAGLRLLAHELLSSAAQLNELHFPPPAEPPDHCQPLALDPEWAAAYEAERRHCGSLNPRLLLEPEEEVRAQGHRSAPAPLPLWRQLALHGAIEVPACPVEAAVVRDFEHELLGLVAAPAGAAADKGGGAKRKFKRAFGLKDSAAGIDQAAPADAPAYPLPVGGGGGDGGQGGSRAEPTPLERAMHEELADSWRTHHALPVAEAVQPGAQGRILEMQGEVQALRAAAEAYLHAHLAAVPAAVGWPGAAWRLQQAAAAAPQHGPLDLVRLALPEGQALALLLNPFLCTESAARLQLGARTWLQLCVLEDRLSRLAALAGDTAALPQLIQELQVHRQWSVDEHPAWLVFEAEQQLQIRPQQYWVAQHLMTNMGHIVQLNMGEGKTRVILPMLMLHFADGHNLVRLVLLPQLLEEAYAHLHATLCASCLGRRLFVQPFHRDVQVTPALLAAMRASLAFCQRSGGVLLSTPERLLSQRLKRQELWQQGRQELVAGLDGLAGLPWLDLLDESDELLTHRYQLIYACGSPTELPAQAARARAAQALLHILSREGRRPGSPLQELLDREGVSVAAGPGAAAPGAWRGRRLLPGAALEAAAPPLRRLLAEALLAAPPYALRWLGDTPNQDVLLQCIVDPAFDATAALDALKPALSDDRRADVLALRGLLGCGVLEHCLVMRHAVEYGRNDGPAARKRLAVPYRAAHVPSERSEYAQPDTALVLTTLAHYHRGLQRRLRPDGSQEYDELLEALQALLSLGPNAQAAEYESWLELARLDVSAAELEPIGEVRRLDPSNAAQLELLRRVFSHNAATVDFWLNSCVFPAETRQFPHRLVATAWDLADTPGGRVVGFSGTNDNHRLLPLAVRQHLEVEAALRGTNGKMLAVLLGNPRYDTLALTPEEPEAWRALLRFAVDHGVAAIIDCGALLAGTTNSAAADFLLPLLVGTRFRGVCYFDGRQWVVCDLQGRRMARHMSPIREAQALTLFDEARCRGADLQLALDAVGLLTLGPATPKDKLMQAAGRLRKLGKGQSLRIIGTADVTAKIRRVTGAAGTAGTAGTSPDAAAGTASGAASGGAARAGGPEAGQHQQPLTSRHVLAWAMANTVGATQRGVLEWAHQGLQFGATAGAPERALQPEVLDLEAMYGAARTLRPLPDVVAQQGARRLAECGEGGLAGGMRALMERVVDASAVYGAGHQVVAQGGLGEECERELEREEEEEEEVERQVARVEPAAEADWLYARALGAASVADLQQRTGLGLLPLEKLAARLAPAALRALPWSPFVFCTTNFAFAVQQAQGGALNEYLRPVGAVLLLPAAAAAVGDSGSSSSSGDDKAAVQHAIVLLSEREANGLLQALWAAAGGAGGSKPQGGMPPLLTSLAYLAAAQPPVGAAAGGAAAPLVLAAALRASGGGWQDAGQLAAEVAAGAFLPPLVSARLFDGETTYVEPRQLEGLPWQAQRQLAPLALLRRLVAGHGGAAEELVAMRGKQALFERSQLERACDAEP